MEQGLVLGIAAQEEQLAPDGQTSILKCKLPVEGSSLEFRIEFFHALNHPQFSNPVNDFASPAFWCHSKHVSEFSRDSTRAEVCLLAGVGNYCRNIILHQYSRGHKRRDVGPPFKCGVYGTDQMRFHT